MGAIEINTASTTCRRCGRSYGRLKGNYPVCYAPLYKGVGYLPYCRGCVDEIFENYLTECKDAKEATRQTCRKLDLYWNEAIFRSIEAKSSTRSMMTQYIARINSVTCMGKCYDDTLRERGALWNSPSPAFTQSASQPVPDVPEGVVKFWGPGYTPDMYRELEERKEYWISNLPEGTVVDIGTEALIRQISSLEIDINRDRAAGKAVDKNVSLLNNLLGSAMLRPAQKKDDVDSGTSNTPFGVWIKRFEDERPIPEPDPELQDVDGIVRYITIWFLGHLGKMLGLRNSYTKLYEDEIAKRRVERPEYEDEDDETVFNDIFASPADTADE